MEKKKQNVFGGSSGSFQKEMVSGLKRTLGSISIPAALISREHKFLYVNREFNRMFGVKLQDIPDLKSFLEKTTGSDKKVKQTEKQWKAAINELGTGKKNSKQFNLIVKSGNELNFTVKFISYSHDFYGVIFEPYQRENQNLEDTRLNLNKYRIFFESASEAILLMKNNRFVDCNNKTLEMFRCTREQIINHSPHEFSPAFQPDGKSSKQKAQSLIIEAYNKKSIIFEWVHRTYDGEQFFAEVSLTPISFDSGKLLQAVVRDISDRKNMELQLKKRVELENLLTSISAKFLNVERKNFLSEIIDAFGKLAVFLNFDACFLFEFSDDYKFISCKTAWSKFGGKNFGKNLQNLKVENRKWWFEKIKKLQPVIVSSLNQIPKTEKIWINELKKQNIKSFINIPVLEENKLLGFLGFTSVEKELEADQNLIPALKIFSEIISNSLIRHKIEEELRESEERFRSLYENAKIGIYRSTLDGKFELANPALIKMFGCNSFEEISKLNIPRDFYVNPDDRKKLLKLVKAKGEIDGFETLIRTRSGEIINVRVYGRIVEDKKSSEKYLEGVVENITEKKQAEKALIESKEKAERSDRLKSEFLAQMSHEIRTPINTILSFSSLLKSELYDLVSDDIKQSFSLIERAGKRITRTIDLILNMSELQTGTYEPSKKEFDLFLRVVEPLYFEYSATAKSKNVEMILKKTNGNYTLFADEYTVGQIFNNLFDNAVKYTEKGKITVSLKKDKDKNIIVEVADTGIGISEEYLPNLFTPFSQEEQGYTRKFEGNGLGLALVKKYCEINNAEISVKSKKGKGTKFRILFHV